MTGVIGAKNRTKVNNVLQQQYGGTNIESIESCIMTLLMLQ